MKQETKGLGGGKDQTEDLRSKEGPGEGFSSLSLFLRVKGNLRTHRRVRSPSTALH